MQEIQNISRKLQLVRKGILTIFSLFAIFVVQAQVLKPLGNGLPSRVVASFATTTEYFALFEDLTTPIPNDYTLGRWNGVMWKYYPGLTTPSPILGTMGSYNFHSVAFFNNEMYVAAYIANASRDAEVPVSHLYKWSNKDNEWQPEVGVVDTKNDGIVAMTVFDNKLIVAGRFNNTVNGKSVNNIASFDGNAWNYLGSSDLSQGADGLINALQVVGNRLYIAGDFQNFAGSYTGNIAYFTASNGGWGGVGSPFAGEITALAYFDNQLAALGKDSWNRAEVRTFKSGWSKPIDFDSFSTAQVNTIAGTPNYLLLGGDFLKDGNASSLLKYENAQLTFTGNRLQGLFTLGQRGNGAFVWGNFVEQNTDIRFFSSIESEAGNLYGALFYDLNSNCVREASETGLPNTVIRLTNKATKQNYFAVTDAEGHFSATLPEGDYAISHSPNRHMYTVCASNYATTIRAGKYSSVFLGEYMDPTTKDLEVSLKPVYGPELVAGDDIKVLMSVTNRGATKLNGPTIHINHAAGLTNFSSTPLADNYEGTEATFSLIDLMPFETRFVELNFKMPVDATETSSYPINVKTGSLFSQNDIFKNDNFDTIKLSIGKRSNGDGAVEKISSNGEKIDYKNTSWKYTVNFKNTSSTFVNKAVMVDTLSDLLPLQQVLLKSFYPTKATYSIQQGRILVVNFDPANLTSVESNPKNSGGWVEYQVDLYEKLPLNTVIPNTAMVSFDSRWEAHSNQCAVTMVDLTASTKNLNKGALLVHPNPVSHILYVEWQNKEVGSTYQIFNHLGEVVSRGEIVNNGMGIDVSNLISGIYILSTSNTTTKIQVIR